MELRTTLQQLEKLLASGGESSYAARLAECLRGDEAEVSAYLTSNELWGGAGSIADQGLDAGGARGAKRLGLEQLLVALGEAQISVGLTNPRTSSWVDAFRNWHARGI